MASWIVHLRLAETLLEQIPGLDAEKFALGSTGPDSGKPDAKWENFTPHTALTHFQNSANPLHDCADLDFFTRYLLPLRPDPEPRLFSFRLGYFFHLVTDNLWSREIGRPTQERWAAKFAADREFIWEVKRDWYGLDFIHLRDHKDCIFWRVFRTAQPENGDLEFIVPESIAWSVAHIQQYYQRSDADILTLYDRPFIYLSQAEVDRFVSATAVHLKEIYDLLWVAGNCADHQPSALALL